MNILLTLCAIIFDGCSANYDAGAIVMTMNGPVQGMLTSDEFATYYSFKGIPYAESPAGANRFKPPTPKRPWSGILDATKEGPVCYQSESESFKREDMSEDCLSLNIYIPANQRPLMPVIVYVHGGEFKSLAGRADPVYGPQLFIQKGVIFVAVNYRLGALGFLSTGDEKVSGNSGIKDVLLALKWVKNNIALFGGDPENITLGGNSAGAVLVHYLMLSEQSSGLFKRTFLISGSALGFRFLSRNPIENMKALGKTLGFTETDDIDALLENIKNADAFDIVMAQENMGNSDLKKALRPFAPFVPCVETESDHAIITREPLDIIMSGIPQNVPVLAGFNSFEGIKMLPVIAKNTSLVDLLNENIELIIPSNVRYPIDSDQAKDVAKKIHEFYFKGENISAADPAAFINFLSDTQFIYAIDSWIKAHKEQTNSNKVWYYTFDFDGDLNWFKIINNVDYKGTSHADELGYFFVTNKTKNLIKDADEASKEMMETLLTLWTNFSKDGIPSPLWVSVPNSSQRNHLVLNQAPQMVYQNPLTDRMEFWSGVYNDFYTYAAKGGKLSNGGVP